MITNVIALLDKADPPAHAFVDGLMASVLAKGADVRVRILVSRSPSTPSGARPRRYLRAVCIPRLYRRRGPGRFANLAQSICLVLPQIIRARRRGERVAIFVRNCPVLCVAGMLLRPWADRLVFQSSFPHELVSGNAFMRALARLMYRLAALNVDAILAVSPLGLKRLRRIFGPDLPGTYIPLLTDVPTVRRPDVSGSHHSPAAVRFVYIGSHDRKRDMELVLRGVVDALERGISATFRFVGGQETEVTTLRLVTGVQTWERRSRIEFVPPVPRAEIWNHLADADVGLCLICPLPEYREASPTKLVEYMAMGLAVVANRGIELQEKILEDSRGGLLVAWDAREIAEALAAMASDRRSLGAYQEAARRFVDRHMTPGAYAGRLRRLLGLPEQPPPLATRRELATGGTS